MLTHADAREREERRLSLWLALVVLAAAVCVWLSLVTSVPAATNGPDPGMRPGDVTQGTLLLRTEQNQLTPAPVLTTDVKITVTGIIARATVHQQFQNPSGEWAEGIYVFPLPETAAVDHLRMRIGERIIEGVIKERAEAKKTYEAAKAEGKRASLVEQERPNIFTTSVANVGPGEAVTVEIEYQETLRYDQGQFRLRFPMVVGPRYIPGRPQPTPEGRGWAPDTDVVPDASRITPPVQHPSKGPINPVSLKIDLAAGFPLARLEAAYHKVTVTPQANGRYLIALENGTVPANRDFELMWQPASEQAPTIALFMEQKDNEVFGLFMVLPPEASALDQKRVPRDAIFVIDTSGSMHGASIEQAKAALHLALSRLQPDDIFNIIQFNHVTHALFRGSVPVNPENLARATRYVNGLTANGGTEMLPALLLALNGAVPSNRLRQIVFLTDGAVGNEDELFNVIRQQLGDSRLFTIGIGSAPNSHFMRKAAEFGRGTFTYIGSPTEVKEKMEALFRKLEHPALTDGRLVLPSFLHAEVLPERIPDLYLGELVMVAIKADRLPERVQFEGRLGNAPWHTELSLDRAANRDGLGVYWARKKIAALMDKQEQTENEQIRRAVIEVAMKHHLVSRYTSLVAVDVTPARPSDKNLQSHALKTNLPEGWDYTAVFGLPQGATSGQLQILLGVLALLLAGGLYRLSVQRA